MAEVRQIPSSYPKLWLKLSFKLLKSNYVVCFASLILFIVVTTPAWFLPLSSLIVSVLTLFLTMGFIEVGRKIIEGEKAKVFDIFCLFKNGEKTKQLLPLIIMVCLISMVNLLLSHLLGESLLYLVSGFLLGLIVFLLFGFSLPLMYYKNLRLKETIDWNLDHILGNIKVFIVFGVLVGGLVFVSITLALIPFIFLLGPMCVPLSFVVYISVFDDFEVEQLV